MRRLIHWRVLLLAAILIAAVVALFVLPVQENLERFLAGLHELGPWGRVLFVLVYIVACVFMIPGTLLSLGAGFVYGPVEGTILVSISSTLGAGAAFWCGRTLARGLLEEKLLKNPRFRALDQAVADEGFKIVFLTRLSPAFPFNLLNYAFGLTRVRFLDYLLASWIGMLPGTILYVYLGYTAKAVTDIASGNVETTPLQYALYGAGLLATVVVTVLVTRLARRALAQAAPQVAMTDTGSDTHDDAAAVPPR